MNYFLIFLNFYVIPLHLAYPAVVKKDLQKQYIGEPEIIFAKVDDKKTTQNEDAPEEHEINKYKSKYLRTHAYNPINDYKYRRLQESYAKTVKDMQSEDSKEKYLRTLESNTENSNKYLNKQESNEKPVKDIASDNKYLKTQGFNTENHNKYLRLQESFLKIVKDVKSNNTYVRTHDFHTENDKKYLRPPQSTSKTVKDVQSQERVNKHVNKYLRPQQRNSKTVKDIVQSEDSDNKYFRTHDFNTDGNKYLIKQDIDFNIQNKNKYPRPQESDVKTVKVMQSQEKNNTYEPQVSNLKTVKDIQIDRKNLGSQKVNKEKKFEKLNYLSPNEIKKLEDIQNENLHKVVKKKNDEIIDMLRALARQHGIIKKKKDVESRRDTMKVLESQSLRDLKERVEEHEVVRKEEQLKKEVEEMEKQAEEAEQKKRLREELSKQQETKKEPRKDLDPFDIAFGLNTDTDTGDSSSSSSVEDLNNPFMRADSGRSESEEQLNFNIAGESIYLGLF